MQSYHKDNRILHSVKGPYNLSLDQIKRILSNHAKVQSYYRDALYHKDKMNKEYIILLFAIYQSYRICLWRDHIS